ncbi:very long chain fatty acid elongase 7-like isoform X2 [Palaemon carinicauda]|uniref:very long chain fatty acid elongase 7-like isoform X2 n=1 Tax=Palaemon carinicauda TaxID=392227 RepID=UPI0035B67507
MSPSQSTPCFIAAQKQPIPEDTDELKELRSNGKWAAGIVIASYVYGEYTVAKQLPRDPRQNGWWLMSSPIPTMVFCLIYIFAVTYVGPNFMKNRKPMSGLRSLMMLYNAIQVVYSAWLFYESGMGGWFGHYKLFCELCDFSNSPMAIRMMHCGFWYYFSKLVDFIDTIFFILHKKYEHISLLHVSHHALMPISMWYGIRYQPGGHSTLMGFLNAFVHTVMYLYYLLAAMGPRVRPFLWWKKYLTTLQMVQFTIVFFHAAILVYIDCAVPKILVSWIGGVAVMFFVLFADFYIKAYRKGLQKGSRKSKGLEIGSSATGMTNGIGSSKLSNGSCTEAGSKLTNGLSDGTSVKYRSQPLDAKAM